MKTKDLFAGCSVTIQPHDDVWLVSLNTEDEKLVCMKTYSHLNDAIEAVHEWTLMLGDEAEISPDAESAAALMREALARLAIGEEVFLKETVYEVVKRDELRTWYEREMGASE